MLNVHLPVVQPEEDGTPLRSDGHVVPSEDSPSPLRDCGQVHHPGHRPQPALAHTFNIPSTLLVTTGVLMCINEAPQAVVHDLNSQPIIPSTADESLDSDLIVLRVKPRVGETELSGQLHTARGGGHQLGGFITQVHQLDTDY